MPVFCVFRSPVLVDWSNQRLFRTVQYIIDNVTGSRRTSIVIESPCHINRNSNLFGKIHHIIICKGLHLGSQGSVVQDLQEPVRGSRLPSERRRRREERKLELCKLVHRQAGSDDRNPHCQHDGHPPERQGHRRPLLLDHSYGGGFLRQYRYLLPHQGPLL